jgi:hypothetical protein
MIRKMKKTRAILFIFLLTLSYAAAQEYDYTNNSFARLSYITGNTFIQNVSDLAYKEGIVNMPVMEGDRVGTTDGRAEIYMRNGTYLRLDNNTKIDFLNIPKQENDLTQVRLWSGNIYFSIGKLEKEKNIEIHTSDVSFYILDRGLYRIDIREKSETIISVYQGMVEAASESGSVLIKESQKMEIVQGQFTSRPKSFTPATDDSFDRWIDYRDSQVRKRMANNYFSEESDDGVKSYKPDKQISNLNIRKIKKKTGYSSSSRLYTRNRSATAISRFYSSIAGRSNRTSRSLRSSSSRISSLLKSRSRLSSPPVMRRPKRSSTSTSKVKKKK